MGVWLDEAERIGNDKFLESVQENIYDAIRHWNQITDAIKSLREKDDAIKKFRGESD